MNGFPLDTNTISELIGLKPNQRVLDWIEAADENRMCLSVMTLGEIRRGVAALPVSKNRTRVETHGVETEQGESLPRVDATLSPATAKSLTLLIWKIPHRVVSDK